MDRIVLTGMEFIGYHGCLPEERQTGQPFIVDTMMYLSLQEAGKSDDLGKTVNYAEVFAKVREIVEGEPCNLIETVAERIAAAILKDFELVERVEVTLHKPEAPIKGLFKDAAVTIERSRA